MSHLPPQTQPPLIVVWRVWEACPLACGFCGYSRELPWPRHGADPQAILRFGRVLSQAGRLSGRATLVSWLGGEPLGWSELASLACTFHSEYGLKLGVTTSGVPLASPIVRASLIQHYKQVTLSIDGLADFHDHVRRQPGLFDRLHQHLERLRSEDPRNQLRRRVNIVLMRENIGQFAPFAAEMARWGFHELSFNQLGGIERPEFFAAHHLLPRQVARFVAELPELRARMAERGLSIVGTEKYLARLQASCSGQAIAIEDCHPGANFLFIDTSGRVSPCSFSNSEYGVPLTELQTITQFLALPTRFRQLRQTVRLAACHDCHATHVFDKFKSPAAISEQGPIRTC